MWRFYPSVYGNTHEVLWNRRRDLCWDNRLGRELFYTCLSNPKVVQSNGLQERLPHISFAKTSVHTLLWPSCTIYRCAIIIGDCYNETLGCVRINTLRELITIVLALLYQPKSLKNVSSWVWSLPYNWASMKFFFSSSNYVHFSSLWFGDSIFVLLMIVALVAGWLHVLHEVNLQQSNLQRALNFMSCMRSICNRAISNVPNEYIHAAIVSNKEFAGAKF